MNVATLPPGSYQRTEFAAARPGVKSLVRACAASGIAAFDRVQPAKVAAREWSGDRGAEWLVRAATEPTTTLDAPELVRTVIPDIMATLAPRSAAARLFSEGLQLSFDGAGTLAVPTILGDSTWAVFVKEGEAIPVMQGQVEPLTILRPHKLAVIVVMTTEMLRSSNLEALMLDALIRSAAWTLDSVLLDDQPGDDTRPAGLRYNIAAMTASTAPDPVAALMQDIETVHRAVSPVTLTNPVLVMGPTRALMAELRSNHGLRPLIVLGSQALRGTMILMAITPNNLASVIDGVPAISASREGTLHMNTLALPDLAGAAPIRSMWQTDCVAILVKIPVTWGVRSSLGVAWTVSSNW